MSLTYATVCSGVEGCSLALEAAPPTRGAWEPVFFSEVAPFPSAVLEHRWPHVPNLGDLSKITLKDGVLTNGARDIPLPRRLDLLAGGTPCQDFSVAGLRGGAQRGSGTRSSLCWEWLRLVAELRPRAVLWENVVGCLSTNGGADFAGLVAALDVIGYCVAWRVLDCQYTRVDCWPMAIPQRRRRVWLVGLADADPERAAKVLFEPAGLLGDTPPRRNTRQASAAPAGGRVGFANQSYDQWCDAGVSATLKHTGGVYGGGSEALIAEPDHCLLRDTARTITGGHDARIADTGNLVIAAADRHAVALGFRAKAGSQSGGVAAQPEVAVTQLAGQTCEVATATINGHTIGFSGQSGGKTGLSITDNLAPTLTASQAQNTLSNGTVRRLTPEECERLMGYPEGHTRIPWRGKPAEDCPDGPRYEACGNGWAINCARWVLLGIHQFLAKEGQP